MTYATRSLINELSQIVDTNKYLLLSGCTGVGKTYLATEIVNNCLKAEYNSQGKLSAGKDLYDCELEFVPIHPSFSYEDFVSGISIATEDGTVIFRHEDKLLLSLLKKANESWRCKDDKKYFLILDDIGRGAISGILGDVLPLIEPHGECPYKVRNEGEERVWLSPNVYIIATKSTTIESLEQFNYGFFRHFYERSIENDFKYMDDDASTSYSEYDISANAMYYRARRIVTDNLRHRFQISASERDKYVIGHGIYKADGTTMIARYQIVPMLRQYVMSNGTISEICLTDVEMAEAIDRMYEVYRCLLPDESAMGRVENTYSVGTQVWNIDKAISTEGKSFARALIILQEARRTGVLSSKIDKYCSVLECIYAIKKEHKKNISNITAAYIGKDSEEQERIRENMRDAYGVRSDGSHGDNLKYLQENNRENLVKLSTDIDDYVRRVFRKVIAVENLNYNNTSEEKARVRKYFSDLAKTVYPE